MKVFLDLPDGFYAIKDHELYMLEIPVATFANAKTVKIPSLTFSGVSDVSGVRQDPISDEIQHVGYDAAQLGREK